MNNPKYVKVDDELFEINTDFRIALRCDEISKDENIGDYERALAIIYLLFGEKGLACQNQNKLIELAVKYLILGKKQNSSKSNPHEEYELDFNKCKNLIKSSFKFDYGYDPYKSKYLHWYEFYNDLENLSTSEFGSCCALNRIASILNKNEKEIKDNKERQELIDLKKDLKQKYCIEKKEEKISKEQEESAREFYKSIGIDI